MDEMMNWEAIPWVDVIGYMGAGVTIWGMSRRTMIPLRMAAVGGNLFFLGFGLLVPSYPTMVLHAVLLPINALRTMQMMRLIREMREASQGQVDLQPLLPYMKLIKETAGSVLFNKGQVSERMIVIKHGRVRLAEIGVICEDGEVLGEISAFTPDNRRTCTGICETDCELYTLDHETMLQLYYQNPQFGMYLIRTITNRLLSNWEQAEQRARAL